MNITITGQLGSGKSTAARLLAEALGAKRISTGEIQRQIAETLNISTLELNKRAEKNRIVDDRIDGMVARMGAEETNAVFDSHMAWHFARGSFNVLLAVDPTVGAERIYHAERGISESYTSVEQAYQALAERTSSEVNRYHGLYGVNLFEPTNFHLIVDTTHIHAEAVVAEIVKAYGSFVQKKAFHQVLLSPKSLTPCQSAGELNPGHVIAMAGSLISPDSEPVEVLWVDFKFYLLSEIDRVAASLSKRIGLIPAKILSKEDPRIRGRDFREYVRTEANPATARALDEYLGLSSAGHH